MLVEEPDGGGIASRAAKVVSDLRLLTIALARLAFAFGQ